MATIMREQERSSLMTRLLCSRYSLPVFSVAIGLVIFGVYLHAGDRAGGAWALGIMTAFGALVLLGGRSETIRGLRGDGRDERFAMIDMRATAFAGAIVVLAIIVGLPEPDATSADRSRANAICVDHRGGPAVSRLGQDAQGVPP